MTQRLDVIRNNPRQVQVSDFTLQKNPRQKIELLMAYGVMAPSTHNSQPWLFELADDSCLVMPDPERRLPEADPTGRDLYISLGCLVENIIMAAGCFGVRTQVRYQKTARNSCNVRVTFPNINNSRRPSPNERQQLQAIKDRVNVRGKFESKPLSRTDLAKISRKQSNQVEIGVITDSDRIEKIASLTGAGIKNAYKRASFRREFGNWLNSSLSRRREGIPGYALKIPVTASLLLPTIIKKVNIGAKLAKLNYASITSAAGIIVLSADNTPKDWLTVGRKAQEIIICLEQLGIRTSIFVAAIEDPSLNRKLQKVASSVKMPQFLFCIGHIEGDFRTTPRLPLAAKTVVRSR